MKRQETRAAEDTARAAGDLSGELVIHPRDRGHGLGLELVREMIEGERDDGGVGARVGASRSGRDVRWLQYHGDRRASRFCNSA